MSEIFELIHQEADRQEQEICLIASENYVSPQILQAQGSILTNKYAEGYPQRRYYGGCGVVDAIEQRAIDLAKRLFDCKYANVQPHSGSQANQATYNALLKPGDAILSMSLDAGGHLSHGAKVSSTGKLYKIVHYGLDQKGFINYEEIKNKLYESHPRAVVVGASAYPRIINFKRIREIVDQYNTWLKNAVSEEAIEKEDYQDSKCYIIADIAHIAGLVAAGLHQSPLPYADVVTTTTHKTLRGPRGGLILSNDEQIGKLINKSVFPGIQGGPLMHVIAAKAICFEQALRPGFINYIEQLLSNIKAMENVFTENHIDMVSGGSDNHMILLDLRKFNLSGDQLERALQKAGIITNKNAVVNDPLPKTKTSGLRIGAAAITTRGLKQEDSALVAKCICQTIEVLSKNYDAMKALEAFSQVSEVVKTLTKKYPIYRSY